MALCKKGAVLLLIDEAQELARSRENEYVATALRTAITLNQDKLRVVFTGSSRTRLASVFSDSKAPLYSSGVAITDFPLLDREFVDFILDKFKAASGNRTVAPDGAWKAFKDFDQQPEPFLKCIFLLLIHPGMTLAEACRLVREERLRDENHEGGWAAMDATQKALVHLLAKDTALKPFSAAVVAELRRRIGVDSLQKTHVQRAIGKLVETGVLTKGGDGNYLFENPSFKAWVQTLAP